MRTIILRDDDTNALTPVECLEKLYRPFLDRGLPVNLAVIPEVRTDVRLADGRREGFLRCGLAPTGDTAPLAENPTLVEYLLANPGYHVAQHGCHHDLWEFHRPDRAVVAKRLDRGAAALRDAGFDSPAAFVAPYDKLSPAAYEEAAKRFRVISTGWFEWGRVPRAWRGRYLWKKLRRQPHWRVGRTWLLSHPGCLLSYTRSTDTMLATVKRAIARQQTTVLVTHWWEYFRNSGPDLPFIQVLHEVAEYLADQSDVRVVSFGELVGQRPVPARPASPVVPKVAAPPASTPAVVD